MDTESSSSSMDELTRDLVWNAVSYAGQADALPISPYALTSMPKQAREDALELLQQDEMGPM